MDHHGGRSGNRRAEAACDLVAERVLELVGCTKVPILARAVVDRLLKNKHRVVAVRAKASPLRTVESWFWRAVGDLTTRVPN